MAPAALGYPHRLGRASRHLPLEWRSPRTCPAEARKWGMLRLTTVGRRSGNQRRAILAYFEDGPNLVTLAMNGWGNGEPAWWLNLMAHPDATVELSDGARQVHAHAASGDERERLWAKWREFNASPEDLDAYAARRSTTTAVVVLEPRSE